MNKKTLGIIGGVGPLATMLVGEMIVRRTKAFTDQEHVHFIIDNDTRIPDRTAHILNPSEPSPVPLMVEDTHKLATAGAELIAIPCNTAHTFYDELQENSPVPVLHMIRETANKAKQLGAKRVGVLATIGTLTSGVYQHALEEVGLEPVIPNEQLQKQVMSIIYDCVKAGKTVTRKEWNVIEEAIKTEGCDRIILGCTELSIVNRELTLDDSYIDSLLVLADCAIVSCGYELLD
ncbi:aspartate/glutamate racemase family protein [Viridibacillus arvi]|uniref:aspartate/glutamate racemase family protein n=1 Tax=Viridibacillus arvi TaxID=263475 RepID=UPI003D016E08